MITYINEQQKLCMAQFQAENDELKADENKPEEQRNVSLSFRRYLVQHNYEKVAAWGSKLLRYMAVRGECEFVSEQSRR